MTGLLLAVLVATSAAVEPYEPKEEPVAMETEANRTEEARGYGLPPQTRAKAVA